MLKDMLKLYHLALENDGMTGSSSKKGLVLNFFFDKEQAAKATQLVNGLDKSFREFLGPQLEKAKQRGRAPEIDIDLSKALFTGKQTEKGVEVRMEEETLTNFFMMLMVF